MTSLTIPNTQRDFYIPSHMLDRKLKVAVIGLGGTGSAFLTELFQMDGILKRIGGYGFSVDAYDADMVSESNVFRQNFWPHDLGKSKAEVLINRFNQFGGLSWNAIPEFFTAETATSTYYDIIITAVDKASVRYEIGEALLNSNHKGLWLDLGNNNHEANVLLGSISKNGGSVEVNENALPTPFQLFGKQWKEASEVEVDVSSCSTLDAIHKQTFGINSMAAKSAASMLLFPLLRFGKLSHHGLFINLHEADISKMLVDPFQWSLYGYEATVTLGTLTH